MRSESYQLLSGAPAQTAVTSDAATSLGGCGKWIDVSDYNSGSIHVVATGIDHVDATVKVEFSNRPDPAVGTPPTGTLTVTLSSAAEFYIAMDSRKVTGRWMRLNYAKGSNTTGTIDAYAHLKI